MDESSVGPTVSSDRVALEAKLEQVREEIAELRRVLREKEVEEAALAKNLGVTFFSKVKSKAGDGVTRLQTSSV